MIVKHKEIISVIGYYFMLFCVLFLRWYNNTNLLIYISTFLCIILFIFNIKEIKFTYKEIISVFILLIYILINYFLTKEHTYIFQEVINYCLIPLTFAICFKFLTLRKENYEKLILKPSFIIFNIYYIINFFIILKQFNYSGFLVHNFTNNPMYEDQIDGLLGCNGTHRLSIFNLICLYINYMNFNSKSKGKRIISKIMFAFITISSTYVSVFNDNRMYYLLLIVFCIPIIIRYITSLTNKNKRKLSFNKIRKFIFYFTCIVLLFFLIYTFNPTIKKFTDEQIIDKYIVKTVDKLVNSTLDENTNDNGEERIELFKFALKYGNGYTLGKGLGAVKLSMDQNMPKNFGLCEITSRIYNGGIIYLLILIYIYSTFFNNYFKNTEKITKKFVFLSICIFAIYARVFTMYDETFLIALLYSIFNFTMSKDIKNN